MNAVHTVISDTGALDVDAIRRDFPVLARTVRGLPLSYLDNAASSQRPRAVIDAMSQYYENSHANVHRGVHTLSQEATDLFEGAREKVRRFINAKTPREIVFVRGTTLGQSVGPQEFAAWTKLGRASHLGTDHRLHGFTPESARRDCGLVQIKKRRFGADDAETAEAVSHGQWNGLRDQSIAAQQIDRGERHVARWNIDLIDRR